jgi:hypothetical protein
VLAGHHSRSLWPVRPKHVVSNKGIRRMNNERRCTQTAQNSKIIIIDIATGYGLDDQGEREFESR